MSNVSTSNTNKKLVEIDITSDTVCPWCCVGKRNLDRAIASSSEQYTFKIRWHPYQLDPDAPKEGVDKREYYRRKFGAKSERMEARMTEIFRNIGLTYNMNGLTGNTLDSHRLIYYAGQKDLGKQHRLVEDLFLGYFTNEKYIGDHDFLLECANKIGLEGAAEFLQDPNNGLKEVEDELKALQQTGVPHYVINGSHAIDGAQPPEVFMKAFESGN